ncbi:UDP-2,3-diacylglucosamine diphosphatase [Neptunicella marina]|uniref:UDP-2,3-diacylglucosamine hydrolase n=1 Tax=Neptunicella marina TaxID=2125989 RepID=A0A8J6M5U4_9ALTE|nr:UDP-2,3-diacylglucosamine diphosphatase [Neptunicella marina]MBC3766746.1 UDP-2,3-diacylglucosamine diphosphatase [Neptunicella marina]
MKTLFIADLHLTESRPDITRAFLDFVQTQAIQCDALYVLGDLFEVWIGDDDNSPLNQQVKSAFKQLHQQNIPVYFIHGNRDFLVGKRFARETGVTLLPEQQVIDLYGTPVLIMHGDSLCTLDTDYQAFRQRSRSWWWKTAILSLPLFIRRKIGDNARQKSQQANQYKSSDIMDVTPSEVTQQMKQAGVNTLIHGHTHRPNVHQFSLNDQSARRIVLGDWFEQNSVLEVTPTSMQLHSSPLPKAN